MDQGELLAIVAGLIGTHTESLVSCVVVTQVCDPTQHDNCGTHLFGYPGLDETVPTLIKGVVRASMDQENLDKTLAYLGGGIALIGERDPQAALHALFQATQDVTRTMRRDGPENATP